MRLPESPFLDSESIDVVPVLGLLYRKYWVRARIRPGLGDSLSSSSSVAALILASYTSRCSILTTLLLRDIVSWTVLGGYEPSMAGCDSLAILLLALGIREAYSGDVTDSCALSPSKSTVETTSSA